MKKKHTFRKNLPGYCFFADVSAGGSCDHFSFNESKLPVRLTGFSPSGIRSCLQIVTCKKHL